MGDNPWDSKEGQYSGPSSAPPDLYASYPEAIELVLSSGKASTSFVQRKLRMGYNQAARLIERMEREGLISHPDAVGRREVLTGPALERRAQVREELAERPRADLTVALTEVDWDSGDDALTLVSAEEAAASAREAFIAECEASGAAKARREGRIDEESATVLDQIAERGLGLMARRDAINQDIRDLFSFAKDIGFHTKALRGAITDMRKLPVIRKEEEAQREIYRAALGVEGPDFVIVLPKASATAPVAKRKISAKEKAFQDVMLLADASSAADAI